MAAVTSAEFHADFLVESSAAVDPASLGAVSAVNQDYAVRSLNAEISGGTQDTAPLKANDIIVAIPPATLEAGIAIQGTVYKDASTVTVRFTNASAGAIDMASQAAGNWKFLVHRR